MLVCCRWSGQHGRTTAGCMWEAASHGSSTSYLGFLSLVFRHTLSTLVSPVLPVQVQQALMRACASSTTNNIFLLGYSAHCLRGDVVLCVLPVQVQQALMRADWPQELLTHQKQLDCAAAGLTAPGQLIKDSSNHSNHSTTPRLSSYSTTPVSPLLSFVSTAAGNRSSAGGNGLSFASFAGAGARGSARRSQSQSGQAAGISFGPTGMLGGSGNRAAAAGQPYRHSSTNGSSNSRDGGSEQRLEGQGSSAAGVGSSLWQQGPLRSISGGVASSSGGFGEDLLQVSAVRCA